MAKTPVSILQEISAQLKIAPPQYDILHNRLEGLNSEFKFQVTFNGIVAIGVGRSKKEARHNAAEMAITKLSQQKAADKKLSVASVLSPGEPVASPFNNQVTRNYVGELAELCSSNNLPAPVYKEVMAEGPSHAPSFTLCCYVSRFSMAAQASTKKQAKHCVAKKMLARIEECLLNDSYKRAAQTADSTMDAKSAADEAREVSAMVSRGLNQHQELLLPTIDSSLPIAKMHLALEEKFGAAPPKLLVASRHDKNSLDWNPYVHVQKIAEEMGVSCYVQITVAEDKRNDRDEDISYYMYVSESDQEFAAITMLECTTDDNSTEDSDISAQYLVHLYLVTVPLSVVFGHSRSLSQAKKMAAEKMIAHLERMILGLPKVYS